jgi:hypothetical protein
VPTDEVLVARLQRDRTARLAGRRIGRLLDRRHLPAPFLNGWVRATARPTIADPTLVGAHRGYRGLGCAEKHGCERPNRDVVRSGQKATKPCGPQAALDLASSDATKDDREEPDERACTCTWRTATGRALPCGSLHTRCRSCGARRRRPAATDFTHNAFNAPAPVAGAVFGDRSCGQNR